MPLFFFLSLKTVPRHHGARYRQLVRVAFRLAGAARSGYGQPQHQLQVSRLRSYCADNLTLFASLCFRFPVFANSVSVLRARVERTEGRKLYMACTLEDAASGRLQAESTTLFVNIPVAAGGSTPLLLTDK